MATNNEMVGAGVHLVVDGCDAVEDLLAGGALLACYEGSGWANLLRLLLRTAAHTCASCAGGCSVTAFMFNALSLCVRKLVHCGDGGGGCCVKGWGGREGGRKGT